jgi:hypothetical protein
LAGSLSYSLGASLSSATSAQDSTLVVEPPSSGFSSSSDAIGEYSVVGGIYQNKQGLDKTKQNISDVSISMNRKKTKGLPRMVREQGHRAHESLAGELNLLG